MHQCFVVSRRNKLNYESLNTDMARGSRKLGERVITGAKRRFLKHAVVNQVDF